MFTVQLIEKKSFTNRWMQCDTVESNGGALSLYRANNDTSERININEESEYMFARIYNSSGVELFIVDGKHIDKDNVRKSIENKKEITR